MRDERHVEGLRLPKRHGLHSSHSQPHSRPQTLRFLDRARRLWGTLRKRNQNLAMPVPQRMLSPKPKWRLTWMQLSRLP